MERGECDFMAEFARHFPSMVIGEMLGLPVDRREPILEWTESLIGISRNGDMTVDVAAKAIAEEFEVLLEARRSEPRDDLMSALIEAEIDGGRKLTELELLGFCFQLVLAGNDTTTNLIANGTVLAGRARGPAQGDSRSPRTPRERHRGDAPDGIADAGAAAPRGEGCRVLRPDGSGGERDPVDLGIGEPRLRASSKSPRASTSIARTPNAIWPSGRVVTSVSVPRSRASKRTWRSRSS